MSGYGLARLSVVKAKLGITVSTNDTTIKNAILSASAAMENETARKLARAGYSNEVYTAYQRTVRLYLKNYPVETLTSVKFGTTTQTLSSFTLVSANDAAYLTSSVGWNTSDSGIKISYTAGYDTRGWDTALEQIESGDYFNVPYDLEDAIAEYASIIWLKTFASGQARIGIQSVNRSGESIGYESYVQGYPASFMACVERYSRFYG